jgi:ABC-type lipoprotein export system ATPase subunit
VTADPLISLTDVTFGYRRKSPVLQNVTADFHAGQVYAISGPSGGGKSTMLSVIGLLLKPESGALHVLGTSCQHAPDAHRSRLRRHHIGFVFQDALLEPSMTAWQNLSEALPPSAALGKMRERAASMFEQIGLSPDLLGRKALTLSGGQAQRVALVRALLKEPEIVLADEPTGNLDDDTSETVLSSLCEYGRRPGRLCVIVTHDMRIVERADSHLQVGS